MKQPNNSAIVIICLVLAVLSRVSGAVVLEEVIVTAQKREQDLQDIGISVTALSGDDIQTLGMETTTDLISQLPNVEMQDTFGGVGQNVNISIRGVGLNDFGDGTEAPVVVYVDEFYLLPLAAASMLLYDLDRVEALRGPQGTLFGRNATGGLVHFITRKPHDALEAYGDLTFGSFSQVKFVGAVNLPVNDRLSLRFSGTTDSWDGWADNALNGNEVGGQGFWAARAQVLFQATDDLEFLAKIEHTKVTGSTVVQRAPAFIDAATGENHLVPDNVDFYGTCPGCDALGFREEQLGAGNAFDDKVAQDQPFALNANATIATGRITWDLGIFTLTSVTGFLNLAKDYREDCDNSPFDHCRTRYAFDQDEVTQEIRLGGKSERSRWVGGFYYLYQDAKAKNDATLDFSGELGLTGIPGAPFVFDVDWNQAVNAWALFGQIEFDLNDQFTVIAGLRYSEDNKEFELLKRDFIADPASSRLANGEPRNQDFTPLAGLPFFGGVNFTRNGAPFGVDLDFDLVPDVSVQAAGGLVEQDFSNVSAKIELDWHPNDDWLLYASFSRGNKAGGFNNGFIGGVEAGVANTQIPFDQEVLHAYEAGFKATLWEGRARLNAAAFYYDYQDYQAFSFVGLSGVTVNADASLVGGEVEFFAKPVEGLLFSAGASFLDTEVEDISNGVTTKNREMGLAPDITVNGLLRYEWPAFKGTLAVQGDFNYVGERMSTVLNQPGTKLESYVIGNARASYARGNWELAVFVKNIADNQRTNYIFDLTALGGFNQVSVVPPRWFGGSVRYLWQ